MLRARLGDGSASLSFKEEGKGQDPEIRAKRTQESPSILRSGL